MDQESSNRTTMEDLIDEIVALFHLLQAVAARVHQDIGLTAAKRGVLKSLARCGAQTVPQMARARPVSRQYIQAIVNQLRDAGLVEMVSNPGHKRSGLIRLTSAGQGLVAGLTNKERDIFSVLQIEASDRELQTALSVLRMIKDWFNQFNRGMSPPEPSGRGE